VTSRCLAVCDGQLASATSPSVCYFPIGEGTAPGVYLMTNDTTRLAIGTQIDGAVLLGGGQNAPISASDTGWPYKWSIAYPADIAASLFKLSRFTAPVASVGMYFKARQSGQINSVTNMSAFADDGTDTIATGLQLLSRSWQVENLFVDLPTTRWFDYSGTFNAFVLGVTGDGLGHVPDLVDLNWLMLQIEP
jgi:hypothetical protein